MEPVKIFGEVGTKSPKYSVEISGQHDNDYHYAIPRVNEKPKKRDV